MRGLKLLALHFHLAFGLLIVYKKRSYGLTLSYPPLSLYIFFPQHQNGTLSLSHSFIFSQYQPLTFLLLPSICITTKGLGRGAYLILSTPHFLSSQTLSYLFNALVYIFSLKKKNKILLLWSQTVGCFIFLLAISIWWFECLDGDFLMQRESSR